MSCNCATYRPLGSLGAAFEPAYAVLRRHEGGYANHPQDKGGETYAGIARNFHPSWQGWSFIDLQKKISGQQGKPNFIATNTKFPQLESLVTAFYRDMWDRSRAAQLNDQQLANNYFDIYILGSQAVRLLQRAINKLGGQVAEDNAIGPQTINAANALDPKKLNDALVTERINWHKSQVANGVVAETFLKGWVKRASFFGNGLLSEPKNILGIVALATLGIYVWKRKEINSYLKKMVAMVLLLVSTLGLSSPGNSVVLCGAGVDTLGELIPIMKGGIHEK